MAQQYPELPAEKIITEPETLKIIADSFRMALLREFHHPRTVKEVSETLGMPPTKLYYHVNLLEKHGLIEVIDTNVISGIIEKTYRITARRLRLDESLLAAPGFENHQLENLVSAILDEIRQEMMAGLRHGLIEFAKNERQEKPQEFLWRGVSYLTPEEAEMIQQKIAALFLEVEGYPQERQTAGKNNRPYAINFLFYPLLSNENSSQ